MTPEDDACWINATELLTNRLLRNLTAEQRGAWFTLAMHTMSSGGSLPDEDQHLARLLKLDLAQWVTMRPMVARCFLILDGRWCCPVGISSTDPTETVRA